MTAMRSSWLRGIRWGVVALLAVYAVMHIAAIWTESINWDEFGIFWRAEKVATTGVLVGGGRPGLAVVVLTPFIDGCGSTIEVAHRARLLWALFTFGIFSGTFCFVRAAARSQFAAYDALIGLAAFMLLPVVMRWSLQVRTDQPAIACAIWGGVALLASRRWPAVAAVAGFAIGVGYLFSQKAVYVGALVAIVAAGDLFVDRELRLRREAVRVGLVLAGGALAIVLYRVFVSNLFDAPPEAVTLEHGFNTFHWYRHIFGMRMYRGMLPSLWPQIALLVMVIHGFSLALRHRGIAVRRSGVALAALVAGIAVALFHAAAFPYFTITLGVFAATAIGMGWGSVREYAPRLARYGGTAAIAILVAVAIPYRIELMDDTQAIQRTSLDFADALPRTLRGFQSDGALVCRRDPSPLPTFVLESIEQRFAPAVAAANEAALLAEFRGRPIAFVVETSRFLQFPTTLQTFWSTHYLPYAGTVRVAGQRVDGDASSTHELDLVVSATYRWLPRAGERLAIEGRILATNDTIVLAAGLHTATLLDTGGGDLILALAIPREPIKADFFFGAQSMELTGSRTDWW